LIYFKNLLKIYFSERWLKTSGDLPPQKKIILEENTTTEDDLIQACENIWKNFLQGLKFLD